MYIYKGKVIEILPAIKNTKKIKVQLEDVLLTFIDSYAKGSNIIIEYAISYFNIPQNINEYQIESHIDRISLEDVIKKTVGEFGKYVSINYLSAKVVKFSFDAKKFLSDASFPTDIVKSRINNQIELKLNRKVPELVRQTSDAILVDVFNRTMNTILRSSNKYNRMIAGLKRLKVSKSMVLTTVYIPDKNLFNVEVKDPLRILYYY